jgi:plastocyanin
MGTKVLLGLIVLTAGLVVGWYIFGGNVPIMEQFTRPSTQEVSTPTDGPKADVQESMEVNQNLNKGGEATRVVVTYTDTGFGPEVINIKQGSMVTFVNESSRPLWVASAVHPTHQLLPGFDQLKSVSKEGVYEYTFTKVGTWKYHNHMSPDDMGTVIVTQ